MQESMLFLIAIEMTGYLASSGSGKPSSDCTSISMLVTLINEASKSKDVTERFSAMGFETQAITPEALGQKIKVETAKWGKAIKEAGIQPE